MLINQFLVVGYINFAGLANSELINLEGSYQGSLLSPFFCDILFNDLDTFLLNRSKNILVKNNSTDLTAGPRYLNTSWEKV